jgi:hypothetical protein
MNFIRACVLHQFYLIYTVHRSTRNNFNLQVRPSRVGITGSARTVFDVPFSDMNL